MRTVTINSRGLLQPSMVHKERRDVLPIKFDFSLLFDDIDSFTLEGDCPKDAGTQSGATITVVVPVTQLSRTYDLRVRATRGNETRAANLQVKSEYRDRGWNSFQLDYN